METSTIIIFCSAAAVILIVIGLVLHARYVNKTINKVEDSISDRTPHVPNYIGTTSDIHSCFHNPKTNQFSITLHPPTGPCMVWSHEEMNAFDSLMQAFKYDKEHRIEIFTEETKQEFLSIAKTNDKIGWLQWKEDLDKIRNLSKGKYYQEAGKIAKEAFDQLEQRDFKLSSCCKTRLFNLKINGAHRCPTCNKFCKAI
jgi:hypothetical protein